MVSIRSLPEAERINIIDRLKRIAGQAQGVQRMVEDGRDCLEVMDQLAAVKAAVSALNAELLEAFAVRCLQHPEGFPTYQTAVELAARAIIRSGRQVLKVEKPR